MEVAAFLERCGYEREDKLGRKAIKQGVMLVQLDNKFWLCHTKCLHPTVSVTDSDVADLRFVASKLVAQNMVTTTEPLPPQRAETAIRIFSHTAADRMQLIWPDSINTRGRQNGKSSKARTGTRKR